MNNIKLAKTAVTTVGTKEGRSTLVKILICILSCILLIAILLCSFVDSLLASLIDLPIQVEIDSEIEMKIEELDLSNSSSSALSYIYLNFLSDKEIDIDEIEQIANMLTEEKDSHEILEQLSGMYGFVFDKADEEILNKILGES